MERLGTLWYYLEARRRFRGGCVSREQIVRRHLRWIAERSPYFADRVRLFGLENWREWPVANKAEMMANFDAWNTAGVRLEEALAFAERAERTRDFSQTLRGLTVGLSSGTTGSRGIFLASAAERRLWAGVLLARVLRGTLLSHRHRAALFLRADSPLYHSVGSRRLEFAFFDLFQPLEEHGERLRVFRPTVLAAPPSVLVQLAASGWARDLLEPPAILLSVADVLDAGSRAVIEKGFGTQLGQIYQATEGFLAATCPHGRLHWNEDVVVVQKEWIGPERTRYVPILTDFRRATQPVIRYRLDDIIVRGDASPCACGSQFETLEAIEGRWDDILRLPRREGGGEVLIYPDFVRRAIILSVATGTDYTVTQVSSQEWRISCSPTVDLEAVRRQIEEFCQAQGAVTPKITEEDWSPPPFHAKRRRIRRQMMS
jgi:putative adenylate-forming enzyme